MSVSKEMKLFIAGPVGRLEAEWMSSDSRAGVAAVVCHPHPLHGGSMENKVVTTLTRTWRDAGFATLRFNFRGVGDSEGEHAHGVGEVEDLLAVLQWLKDEKGVGQVALAGFSFGAWVAASAVACLPAGLRLLQLALVAPPVQYSGFAGLDLPPGTVVMQGEEDEVVEPTAVYGWAESRPHPPELVRFVGCGHFFHGRLTVLKAELAARLVYPL